METVRQKIDDILSSAAGRDWALHILAGPGRDVTRATLAQLIDAQTVLIQGLVTAVRELADAIDRRSGTE
jgi:hypothetical protein